MASAAVVGLAGGSVLASAVLMAFLVVAVAVRLAGGSVAASVGSVPLSDFCATSLDGALSWYSAGRQSTGWPRPAEPDKSGEAAIIHLHYFGPALCRAFRWCLLFVGSRGLVPRLCGEGGNMRRSAAYPGAACGG